MGANLYTICGQFSNMIYVYTLCDYPDVDTPDQRLKISRENAGFKSARQAAKHYGWTISTYSAHENGQNGYDEAAAIEYGRAFDVSAGWLLTGEGGSERQNIVGVKGLVGAGGSIDTGPEQLSSDENLYEIEVLFPLPAGAFALEVRGDSMFPRYDPGDVVICEKQSYDFGQMIGWEAVVMTVEGSRYLKRLLNGSRKGLFDLESFNARPIRSVRLEWASKVITVVRAGLYRKLDARGRAKLVKKALSG